MTTVWRILRRIPVVSAPLLFAGCSWNEGIFAAAGPVASTQKSAFFWIVGLMMIVILPMIIALPFVLWRYRLRDGKGAYDPDWDFNWTLELLVWVIPVILVAVLGIGLWRVTKLLDPYAPITAAQPELDIDVVMLDWKFLFLYPEEGIATINRLVVPVGRPVAFRLTSGDVMQSFIIPRLGGQIYTMPGMVTRLDLLADTPGQYPGENAQYNGRGFADQKFMTDAMTSDDFDAWVAKTKVAGQTLDAATLAALEKPSIQPDPVLYGRVDGNPFATILAKFGMTPQMKAMP